MEFRDLGITSDIQLRDISRKLGMHEPIFIGFAEDLTALVNGGYIINLGDDYLGGTHWVLLYIENGLAVYSDSYGVGPEDEIIRLLNGRELVYSSKQIQRYEEYHCGIFALMLAQRLAGRDKKMDIKDSFNSWLSQFRAV